MERRIGSLFRQIVQAENSGTITNYEKKVVMYEREMRDAGALFASTFYAGHRE
jgi:hypothetical protein